MAVLNTFNIGGLVGIINVNDISFIVPFGTDVTNMVAEFSGDDISLVKVGNVVQESGVTANNFTPPITYIVVGTDDIEVEYVVTVNISPNTENTLISFDLPSLAALGTINEDSCLVSVVVNEGAIINSIIPVFTISENATCNLVVGNPIDLTSPIVVEVTSESGVLKTYFVNVYSLPDHTVILTVFKMLLNRLSFLENTERNREILSELTFEVMNELEDCFKVGFLPDGTYDLTRVGKELYYDTFKKSIVADVLSINIIMAAALKTVGGDSQSSTVVEPTTKYLNAVTAGSVSVGYDQLSIKDKAILAMDTPAFLLRYKEEVVRKMAKLGCQYEYKVDPTFVPYIGFITSGRAGL